MLYLTATATLSDNIKCVYPKDTEEEPAEFCFELVCTDCREKHDSKVTINRFEEHEMSGGKGKASFVMKCKFCGKDCSVTLALNEEYIYSPECREELMANIKTKRKKHGIKNIDLGKAVLLSLDCRGCEVISLDPSNLIFVVELLSGKTMECSFEDGENEWYDYDEDLGEEVSVTDVIFDIEKGK
ncbi:LAFE_0C00694g1_1 [Lachancea fermentati]|uniref:LAFE_0C00694g1_1 n=1 Tax=Lachancea fermentati TaxID=4955 RepID=A0A1G4M8X3_LACFM|nr:LAFE_0C00694g1_1 [Lachancea fermentati]